MKKKKISHLLCGKSPNVTDLFSHIQNAGSAPLADPHGGHSSYTQNQVKHVARKCEEGARSQPASSSLIFLFP